MSKFNIGQQWYIDIPVKMLNITDLKILEGVGEHGKGYLKGLLADGASIENIRKVNENSMISICCSKNDLVLFKGIPTKIQMNHVGGAFELYLELAGATIKLDRKLQSKSYQDITILYNQIYNEIAIKYGGSITMSSKVNEKINKFMLQYQETDWEFVKRMASNLGEIVYTMNKSGKPQIIIGSNGGRNHSAESIDYKIKKDISEYLKFKELYSDTMEEDCITGKIIGRDNYDIGDSLTFKENEYLVIEKELRLYEGEIINTYRLKRKNKIRVLKQFNEKITGVSIEGTVIKTEANTLKLKLSMDESQEVEKAYSFPYPQGSLAAGQSGWYAMPEKGSTVKLMIPSKDENDAFIAVVYRTDGADNNKTSKASSKYFGSAQGREMHMAPDGITFSVKEDEFYMKLSDEKGIEVVSTEDIAIKTNQKITGEVKTLSVKSKEKIVLKTDDTSILIDEVMFITG